MNPQTPAAKAVEGLRAIAEEYRDECANASEVARVHFLVDGGGVTDVWRGPLATYTERKIRLEFLQIRSQRVTEALERALIPAESLTALERRVSQLDQLLMRMQARANPHPDDDDVDRKRNLYHIAKHIDDARILLRPDGTGELGNGA